METQIRRRDKRKLYNDGSGEYYNPIHLFLFILFILFILLLLLFFSFPLLYRATPAGGADVKKCLIVQPENTAGKDKKKMLSVI